MFSAALVVTVLLSQVDGGVESWRAVGHLDSIARRYDVAELKGDTKTQLRLDQELRGLLKRELDAMRGRADADEQTLKKVPTPRDGGVSERRADARQDLRIGGRLFAIDNELATLDGKHDPKSVERKRTILDELIGLAEQERRRERREKHLDETEK
jgi:hypothetical protein